MAEQGPTLGDLPIELDAPELARLAANVGAALRPDIEDVNAIVIGAIEADVGDLVDAATLTMLHASVEANIATILHMLRNEIPLQRAEPATAASEYAIQLAAHGIPSIALRRAYHFGADAMLAILFEQVRRLDVDEDLRWRLLRYLSSWINGYIDRISQRVLQLYDDEIERIARRRTSVAASFVQRVLDGERPRDFTVRTGYRLEAGHVAIILLPAVDGTRPARATGFEDLAHALAPVLGTEHHLLIPHEPSGAIVWFARRTDAAPVDHDALRAQIDPDDRIRIAVGGAHPGIEGFRRSHRQAESARLVLEAGPRERTLLAATEPAVVPTSMLLGDLENLARWIRRTLGGLAAGDERTAGLRETLRVVFEEQGNHRAAADRLVMHRNSIRYRVQQAEIVRGRPVDRDRLDLELALQIAQLLGPAVLDGEDDEAVPPR